MATENLWGDLSDIQRIESPKSILQEQAGILTSETDGLLVGRIESNVEYDRFNHDFEVVVPSLNNYAYTLLSVRHQIDLYPLYITRVDWSNNITCDNEDEFKKALKEVLSSQKVRSVLTSLLSQVESE